MMRKMWASVFVAVLSLSLFAGEADPAPKAILKKGQRIAIVGDSITEQKQYSRFMEMYLLACMSQLDLNCIQFGWSGETAGGFVNRMNNDLIPFKPDVVTTCYGMNDGGYQKYNPGIGGNYEKAMSTIVKRMKEVGAEMVVGSPGPVDLIYFKKPTCPAEVYNENLNTLGGIGKKLAIENGYNFANLYQLMHDSMEKGQKANGDQYDVCGRDGVHPNADGHLLMAMAFLKGMGLDGQIGTITVDMKAGAEATDGHKVLAATNGKVDIESTRYPFCFSGDDKSSGGTRSMLQFCSFNKDLNRYVLVVKNLDGDKAKVTWGAETKEFSKADLEKGVNLSDFFFASPFVPAWNTLEQKVAAKQEYERIMIKELITRFPSLAKTFEGDKEADAAMEVLRKKLVEKHAKLVTEVRALVVPVKHTITIVAEK